MRILIASIFLLVLAVSCSQESKIKTGNWKLDIDTYISSIKEKADSMILVPVKKQEAEYLDTTYIKYVVLEDPSQAEGMDSLELINLGKAHFQKEVDKLLKKHWEQRRAELESISILFLDGGEMALRDGRIKPARWKISDDNKTLTISYNTTGSDDEKDPNFFDTDRDFEILELTENTLQLNEYWKLATKDMNPTIIFKYAD